MFLAAAAAGIVTMVAAGWLPVLRMDRHVAVDLHVLAREHPVLTHANRILTDWVFDPWTMRLLLDAVAVWLWRRRERLLALWTAGTSAAEAGVRQVLRWAIGRERPRWERPVDSAGFAALPSGHAMTAAASCVLLLWLARRAGLRPGLWRLALAGAVLTVAGACFTRIFLGVHWLTDTFAGARPTTRSPAYGPCALDVQPAQVRQVPVQVAASGPDRARVAAAQRDHDVGGRDDLGGQWLGELVVRVQPLLGEQVEHHRGDLR